ncbi:MAG: aspartate aminotransferase family protein [Planctomycetes bacterium]|nr:aspartate aminotransferase family protein [Planctomycetota bacterium]
MTTKKSLPTLSSRGPAVLAPVLGWATSLGAIRASGCQVECDDGRTYLDFACGTATLALGHCHPAVVEAVEKQVRTLMHTGGVFFHEPMLKLGEALQSIMPEGLDRFFFSNSGTEAIEGAFKLARYVTGRQAVVAFSGGFHGRTMGSLSLTASAAKYRKKYRPLVPEVVHIPFPSAFRLGGDDAATDAVLAAIQDMFETRLAPEEIAAFLLEPIQGEGGYTPAPKRFLVELRKLCDKHGILLVYDEVQTGFARTGEWFAAQHFGVTPDIMAVAKAIGGGLPLGAVCAKKSIMEKWEKGAHGSTFGGNPVACAAALAVVETMKKEKILEKVRIAGKYVTDRLLAMQKEFAVIGDVRGPGLMIGIEFVKNGNQPNAELVEVVRKKCQEGGLVLLYCGQAHNVIRFIPPLNVKKADLDRGLDILRDALKASL